MRIVITTPLYPPDIKEPAPYVKELGARLAPSHIVTILAYNHIPEEIPGVRIVCIEKSEPTLMRIMRFLIALYFLAKNADVLYVQNGPSVELPVLVYLFLARNHPRVVVRLGDVVPLKHPTPHPFTSWITKKLLQRADVVILHNDTRDFSTRDTVVLPRPRTKPEWLPFKDGHPDDTVTYEASWNEHLGTLLTHF